jgi:hypothetical protein
MCVLNPQINKLNHAETSIRLEDDPREHPALKAQGTSRTEGKKKEQDDRLSQVITQTQ